MRQTALFCLAMAAAAAPALAAESDLVPVRTRSALVAPEVAPAPVVDGRLDDAAWTRAQPLREWSSDGRPARCQTEVWLCRDAQRLYLAARCAEDRPADLVTTFKDPPLWRNDCLVVFVVPDRKAEACVALTVTCDGRVEVRGPAPGAAAGAGAAGPAEAAGAAAGTAGAPGARSSPLPGVEVRTGREAGAWTAEVAIPLAALAADFRPVSIAALGVARRKWTDPAETSLFQGGFDRPADYADLTFDDRTVVLDGVGVRNVGRYPQKIKVRLRHGEESSEQTLILEPGDGRAIGWRTAPGEIQEGDEVVVELIRRGGTLLASETYVLARRPGLPPAPETPTPAETAPARGATGGLSERGGDPYGSASVTEALAATDEWHPAPPAAPVPTPAPAAAGAEKEALMSALERAPGARLDLGGVVREYVDAVTAEWLLKMPDANPAVLEMFADRDRKPYRDLLPWSGEFAGKYLTGAVQVLRLTGDERLKQRLTAFVVRLVALQDADGYLGPFPKDSRLTGKAPNVGGGTWDAWGHYHVMLGLLLWHEDTGDPQALACAARLGDLLCDTFLGPGKRVLDMGEPDKNHAIIHGLCLLYRRTGGPRHLALARQIREEFSLPGAGDYVRNALAGREFFQCPKPRWESLHAIMGLAELYALAGDADARAAFERTWWSIARLDRHNHGGFSSGEQAQGDPYHPGAVETCCTVAWIAMSVEMLRLTGRPVVADEIELSTLNAVLGYQSRTGRWCTYNTPMDGVRRPSTEEIAFQKRPGSEEVNCCSANAPRGFGMISDWALMADRQGLVLNWYGPSAMTARAAGTTVRLRQRTDYPRDGRIVLEVAPERPARFALRLRIPHWSAVTRVAVNGDAVPDVRPGTYLALDREWAAGDSVTMDLDMSPRWWVGEGRCAGRAAVYRGPLLLAREGGAVAIAFGPQWRPYGDLWAADVPGATAEHAFEGTGVRWMGKRFDDAGRARVTIDGRDVGVVDQYGPGRGLPFSWEHRGLAAGRHTIGLTVLDEKDERSRGRFINVTGFEAVPEGAAAGAASAGEGRGPALRVVAAEGSPPPIVAVECTTADGRTTRLRDFATAGEGGRAYVSWLEVGGLRPAAFSEANPSRTARDPGP